MEWDGEKVHRRGIVPNLDLLVAMLRSMSENDTLYIEMVACYGMPVGKEVFETVLWIGRFIERWDGLICTPYHLVYRRDVKLHHCGSARAKDSNIRQALIDKYGAPGTKKNPGLTYGLSKDLWSAFAIATYATETLLTPPDEKQSV